MEECQQAFEGIKSHLAELPLLMKLVAEVALYLYITVGDDIIQKPVYFVSIVYKDPKQGTQR